MPGGGVLIWRERRRNELVGQRWPWFWHSPLAEWAVKLAGLGLRRIPLEPVAVGPEPAGLPLPAEAHDPAPSALDYLEDVAGITESCVCRTRACLAAASAARERESRTPIPEELEFEQMLERMLAVLGALFGKFSGVEPGTAEAGSLGAGLKPARAVCEAVEGLIEGREGREWRV